MVYALPQTYTPLLSIAAIEAVRQMLFVSKEYMINGDKTNCSVYLTQCQSDLNTLVTLVNASTNATLSAGAGQAANNVGL